MEKWLKENCVGLKLEDTRRAIIAEASDTLRIIYCLSRRVQVCALRTDFLNGPSHFRSENQSTEWEEMRGVGQERLRFV